MTPQPRLVRLLAVAALLGAIALLWWLASGRDAAPEPAPPTAQPRAEPHVAWPGIDTDLRGLPALRSARVTTLTPLMRKPKANPDVNRWLHEGTVVEVMAEEGPDVERDGTPIATVPVRFGDVNAWVWRDALVPFSRELPPLQGLWPALRSAAGPSHLPDSCTLGAMVADVAPAPGDELLVFGVGGIDCRRALGVFTLDAEPPRLVAWAADDILLHVEARAIGGSPEALILARSQWRRARRDTGESLRITRVPPAPGPLEVVFDATASRIDALSRPVVYELSDFAWPADPAAPDRWLVQWRHTRRAVADGQEQDEATERFYRFDGARFVETERPPGVPELAPPPPTIVRVPQP